MDTLYLSRLQFAAAAIFHFLFVPLTLGLGYFVAVAETIFVRTGDRTYKRMAQFWGRFFIINFAVGVVTGLTLEFQFGTNWKHYALYVGDVFGPLLAIEATAAFFLESTFLAVWIFGWKRLSPPMHAFAIWVVAAASTLSAFFILCANGFMQNPVGFEKQVYNGVERAVMVHFWALLANEYALNQFFHTMLAAFVLSGFFVMGVSAWHLLRRSGEDFFTRSFRLAMWPTLAATVLEVVQGHANGAVVAKYQPLKLAAMESLWRTHGEDGSYTPQTLLVIPDEKNERNLVEWIKVPSALSLLAYHDAAGQVKGLDHWPDPGDRPPVTICFVSFRLMVGLGFLFPLLAGLGVVLFLPETALRRVPLSGPLHRLRSLFLEQHRGWLKVFPLVIPLPYIAISCGWVLAEVGRQPWIVYNVLRTSAAVSPLSAAQVGASLAGFLVLYTLLGAAAFYLLIKFAIRGPDGHGPVSPAKEAPDA
jgi:cytochrome d ubiquinol oxidase subunit I